VDLREEIPVLREALGGHVRPICEVDPDGKVAGRVGGGTETHAGDRPSAVMTDNGAWSPTPIALRCADPLAG
jgi:hypothetical protein